MSTTTGSPAPISPWPDSWPIAACAPWETITSSGSSQPCSLAHLLHRRPHLLGGQPGAQLADQRRGDAHRRVRRLLGAADARPARARVLTRRRRMNTSGVDVQLDARRRAGGRPANSGKSGGTDGARRCPARGRRAGDSSASMLSMSRTGRDSSSRRRRARRVEDLEPERGTLSRVQHESPCGPAAVALQVEERVDDAEPGSRGRGPPSARASRSIRTGMGSPPGAPAPRARGARSSRSRRPRRGRARRPRAPAASRSGVAVSQACWARRWTIR